MEKLKHKPVAIFFILLSLVIAAPVLLMAEGMQVKLKSKINASKNIKGPQQYQYEPYYLASDQFSVSQEQAGVQFVVESKKPVDKLLGQLDRGYCKEKPLANTFSSQETSVISPFSIYKTDYKAELEEDVVTVQGHVLFEVFQKGWTQIPLVMNSVGLIDVSVNNGAAFVTMKGGKYYLMIDRPGRYNLNMEFLIKANRERESGPGSFNFDVMSAPISQFEFTMPESGVDIFVDPSIRLEVKKESKKTVAWAVMPNTQTISVRWTKALPKDEIKPVKLEPKVYVDTATYVAVGEGVLRCQLVLNYSILQAEISNVRIAFPTDISILDVQGRDLRDWKVSSKEGVQYLDVYLNFGIKGNYYVTVSYERKIGEGSVVAEVPEATILGVEREKGFFGIAAVTNVELAVNKSEHVSPIDVSELPEAISRSSTSPILLAFKYLSHPYIIAIDVTKHQEVAVLSAMIDSAYFTTLLTDEGKSLNKAILQVRNNVKQFIHLELPKGATLWSSFVSGRPVKPAMDKDGTILIPLEKSQLQGQNLTQFSVEIVYLDKLPKMGLVGGFRFNLPKMDIPTNNLNWSLYLPKDYLYMNFRGDVKSSEHGVRWAQSYHRGMEGGLNDEMQQVAIGSTLPSTAKKEAKSFLREVESAQIKGVLPIKIDIPESGRLRRFSKFMVAEKESPWVAAFFIAMPRSLQDLFKFLIFVSIIIAIAVITKNKKLFRKTENLQKEK